MSFAGDGANVAPPAAPSYRIGAARSKRPPDGKTSGGGSAETQAARGPSYRIHRVAKGPTRTASTTSFAGSVGLGTIGGEQSIRSGANTPTRPQVLSSSASCAGVSQALIVGASTGRQAASNQAGVSPPFGYGAPTLLREGPSAEEVDQQLELEDGCEGVERASMQHRLADVQNEHPSSMFGFNRKTWSKDPFYAWRAEGQHEPVPVFEPAEDSRRVTQSQGSQVQASQNAASEAGPFASWRPVGPAASSQNARGRSDPFSSWRGQMQSENPQPQGQQRSMPSQARAPRSSASGTGGADPFGSWRPQMQPAPGSQRSVSQCAPVMPQSRRQPPSSQRTVAPTSRQAQPPSTRQDVASSRMLPSANRVAFANETILEDDEEAAAAAAYQRYTTGADASAEPMAEAPSTMASLRSAFGTMVPLSWTATAAPARRDLVADVDVDAAPGFTSSFGGAALTTVAATLRHLPASLVPEAWAATLAAEAATDATAQEMRPNDRAKKLGGFC